MWLVIWSGSAALRSDHEEVRLLVLAYDSVLDALDVCLLKIVVASEVDSVALLPHRFGGPGFVGAGDGVARLLLFPSVSHTQYEPGSANTSLKRIYRLAAVGVADDGCALSCRDSLVE